MMNNDIIRNYLRDEKDTKGLTADVMLAKLDAEPDIKEELIHWIENRIYPADNPVCVEGYTAQDIVKLAPFLDGIGAYMFLISLRTNKKYALDVINAGFPRK